MPKNFRVHAVMGGIDLEFREAVFGPGVSEVNITSVMGGVAVIVPPHLQVECSGVGILGNFEGMNQGNAERDPSAPLLRIIGTAVMGALGNSTRPLGETMKSDRGAHIGQIGQR